MLLKPQVYKIVRDNASENRGLPVEDLSEKGAVARSAAVGESNGSQAERV